MPVTKTAKRALRSSKKKALVNKVILSSMEIAIRTAKKDKKQKSVEKAYSLVDRALKKNAIHKNKAARIKSSIASIFSKKAEAPKKLNKKTSKK
jgi:ribosomal protein S20